MEINTGQTPLLSHATHDNKSSSQLMKTARKDARLSVTFPCSSRVFPRPPFGLRNALRVICSTPQRRCARSLRCAGRRFWGGPGALHRFLHAAFACCMYFCIRLHVFFCSTHRYVSLVCRAGAGKVRARLRLASRCCGFATCGLPAGTPMDVWLR